MGFFFYFFFKITFQVQRMQQGHPRALRKGIKYSSHGSESNCSWTQRSRGRQVRIAGDSSEMALGHIPGGTTGLKEKEAHSPLSSPTSRTKCFGNANFLIQESKFSSNRSTGGLNAPPHAHTLTGSHLPQRINQRLHNAKLSSSPQPQNLSPRRYAAWKEALQTPNTDGRCQE